MIPKYVEKMSELKQISALDTFDTTQSNKSLWNL